MMSRANPLPPPGIPARGLCFCGCGRETKPASETRRSRGDIKGQPVKYALGHAPRPTPDQRFWAKVERTATCWLWRGKIGANGYGYIRVNKKEILAHRFSYELLVGPISMGLQIDHLCRVRKCVNPDHLEAVTLRENVRRGMAPSAISARTDTCPKGHHGQYKTQKDGTRRCEQCRRDRIAARRDIINAQRRANRAARRSAA